MAYDLHKFVLTLLISYTVVGFFIIFTIAGALDLLTRRKMPPEIRAYFYGTYVVSVVGICLGVVAGYIKWPTQTTDDLRNIVVSDEVRQIRTQNVVPSDAQAPSPVTGVVYIQAYSLADAPMANEIRQALVRAGLRSFGVEYVGARSPSAPEVRYFNDGDIDLAKRVADIAGNAGVVGVTVKPLRHYTAPKGQVELWLAKAS